MNNHYLQGIWASRYFWLHLALADIRAKYRRSALGWVWAILQPLGMTLLFTFVMGRFFNASATDYAPFIFSGLIFWEFIVSALVGGCNSFVNAEGYIKQFTHPLLIYTLRNLISGIINLLLAFVGLVIWVLCWKSANFGWSWLSFVMGFPLLLFFTWPLVAITAFAGVRFRDLSQLLIIALQALYYVSPILFLPKIFIAAKLEFLIECNPIYHLLNLFRSPLLTGAIAPLSDYVFVIVTSCILWLYVFYLIRTAERKVIFYL